MPQRRSTGRALHEDGATLYFVVWPGRYSGLLLPASFETAKDPARRRTVAPHHFGGERFATVVVLAR